MIKPAEIRIDGETIIVRAAGRQDAAAAKHYREAIAAHINSLHQQGRKAYVLADITGLIDAGSESRRQAKAICELPFEKMAVVGANAEMRPIAEFFIFALRRRHSIQLFASVEPAKHWLYSAGSGRRFDITVLGAIASVIGGLVVILGWLSGHSRLETLGFPGLPMTILSAIGFVVLGLAIAFRRVGNRRLQLAAAIFIATLGFLDLLRDFLFSSPTFTIHPSINMPVLSAALFSLCGLALLPRKSRKRTGIWRPPLIIGLALVTIGFFGYVYDIPVLDSLGRSSTISIPSVIIFGLVSVLLLLDISDIKQEKLPVLRRPSTIITILFIILIQAVTALSWRQANASLEDQRAAAFSDQYMDAQTKITDRIEHYTNALKGMRSFYHASNEVTLEDFRHYLANLDLAADYPGFRSITYIERVLPSQKAAVTQKLKSIYNDPTITIHPPGERAEYFPVVFLQSGNSAGFDLAASPERNQTLLAARSSGEPTASPTINLNSTDPGKPVDNGFFLTIPLYGETVPATAAQREAENRGYFNTVFEYRQLLNQLFSHLSPNVDVALYDSTDPNAQPVYANRPLKRLPQSTGKVLAHNSEVKVLGRDWRVLVKSDPNTDLSRADTAQPISVIWSGNIITLILILYLSNLVRGRMAALRLVEKMTVDLQYERDEALQQRNKNEAILASIGDGVFAVDNSGKIILFNTAAEKMSGYKSDKALGRHFSEVLDFRSEVTGKPHTAFITKALSGKLAAMANHTVLVRADGSRMPIADSAAPIIGIDGEVSGAIVVFRDVTKEYEVENAKDEFVSLASHQLRTPATGVKQFLGMVLEGYAGPLAGEQLSMIQDAYDSNERQLHIITDMLDVARIDAGRMEINQEKVDVQSLIKNILVEQHNTIAGRQQKLKLDMPKTPLVTKFDPSKMRMVIENLVSNASKYTPEKGSIQVKLAKKDKKLEISVSDSGVGISTDNQHKLFDKFSRISNPLSTKVGGSGLGLYLAKQIVTLHKGEITVKSQPGKGTTFAILLPLKD